MSIAQTVARLAFRLAGWRIVGTLPAERRYLIVVAPHTSNWDFPLAVAARTALGLRARWLGKHTLFWGPNAWFLRSLGGVPVDRSGGKDAVAQIAKSFDEHTDLALAISPEGAKRWKPHWRSGFWYVARAAGVPIVVGYANAVQDLPEGAEVVVDGETGQVTMADEADRAAEEDAA